MKNKGLIITLIILLSIIIFFLVMLLVMYLKGGMSFKNGIFSIGSKSTNIIYDKQFELEDIKDIDIKQDAGDIIIKESENDSVKVVLYGENEGEEQENTENLKNLEVQAKHAFCYFDPPKVHANLKYVENTLELPEDAKFEVEVKDNFFIMAQACISAKDAEKQFNLNLSFRQLNHFKNENGKISFNFYGLTTQDLGIEVTIIIQIHLI